MARKFSELRARMSPESRARAETKAKEMIAEMPLNELRHARGLSQEMLAEALHVQQPSIAKLERRTDMYVSMLRSHIEAMGGELEIAGTLPQCAILRPAVDQDGSVLDILVRPHRDKKAATRFFKKLLRGLRYAPRVVVTDRLTSYSAPCAVLLPNTVHRRDKGLNNRAENSHQLTRERERRMRGFKSAGHAQRFPSILSLVADLFDVGRHPRRNCSRKRKPARNAIHGLCMVPNMIACF